MTKIFKGEKIQYNQEKTKRKTKVRLYERTVECKWERDEKGREDMHKREELRKREE